MLLKHSISYLFKRNKFLFISINLMLFITSVLAFSLILVNTNLTEVKERYEELNQEDFQLLPKLSEDEIITIATEHKMNLQELENKSFTELYTENGISHEDIYKDKMSELEKKYEFESEIQQSKFLSLDGHDYRVVKSNNTINQFYFVEGKSATEENEVVVDVSTADSKDLSVGDSYEFLGESYTISGIASFPAYVNPNMSDSNIQIYRSSTSVLLSFNDEHYETVEASEKVYYSGIWNHSSNEIPSDLVYYMTQVSDNPEINVLNLKINMNQMIVGVSVTVMLSIVLIMLAMNISRMIQDNLKIYGVLKALGYKNKEIIISFLPVIFLLVIPVFLGLIVASVTKSEIFKVMNSDTLIPFLHINLSFLFSGLVIGIFLISVIIFSFSIIYLFLRKDPINLIQSTSFEKINFVKRLLLKLNVNRNFIKSLRYKFLFRNLFVFSLIVFSGFAIGVQLFMGLSILNFPNQMVDAVENQYKYNYNIVFNEETDIANIDDAQGYLTWEMKLIVDGVSDDISLIAIDSHSDHNLVAFYDYNHDKNITDEIKNGVIVSKWFANKYSLKVGDMIKVMDGNNGVTIEIAGVNRNLEGSELYTSIDYYESLFDKEVHLFSGFFSINEPQDDLKGISQTLALDDQIEAIKVSTNNYKIISIAMLVIGLLLGGILLSISLYIAIKAGEKNILLLKSMGYTNAEINQAAIIGNIIPLLLGLIISVPYFILLSKLLFGALSKSTTLYIPMELEWLYVLIVGGAAILFFILIATFYMVKLKNLTTFQKLVTE